MRLEEVKLRQGIKNLEWFSIIVHYVKSWNLMLEQRESTGYVKGGAWWWHNLICISERFWLLTHPHSQQPILYIVISINVLRINLVVCHLSMAPLYLRNKNRCPQLDLKLLCSVCICSVFSPVPSTLSCISAKPPAISQMAQGLPAPHAHSLSGSLLCYFHFS